MSNAQEIHVKEDQVFIDLKTGMIKANVNLDGIIEAILALEATASDCFNLNLEALEFLKQVKALEIVNR